MKLISILEILKSMYQEARPWLSFIIFAMLTACVFVVGDQRSSENDSGFLLYLLILYFYGGFSWQLLNETMKTREEFRKRNQ